MNEREKLGLLCHNIWWLLNKWERQADENEQAAKAHEDIYGTGNQTFLELSNSAKNLRDCRNEILAMLEASEICQECFESGKIDSGGFTPWGSPIQIPCANCVKKQNAIARNSTQ